MFSGTPGEYDPEMGKVFGMNRAEFEAVDEARVEAENKIMFEAENRYKVVCQVRNSIKEMIDDGIPDDVVDMIEQLKEWHDDLEAVTKNG